MPLLTRSISVSYTHLDVYKRQAYSTIWERKFCAFLQDRQGPSNAGWGGSLQPIADVVKMFMKEEIIPNVSNRSLFILSLIHI